MIIVGMGALINDFGSIVLNSLRELSEFFGVVKIVIIGSNSLSS